MDVLDVASSVANGFQGTGVVNQSESLAYTSRVLIYSPDVGSGPALVATLPSTLCWVPQILRVSASLFSEYRFRQ